VKEVERIGQSTDGNDQATGEGDLLDKLAAGELDLLLATAFGEVILSDGTGVIARKDICSTQRALSKIATTPSPWPEKPTARRKSRV
jgi:hypothetical protein